MAKEAYYFSHDSNARHDPKILALRSVYGSEGYGWYWIIVEMLREQEDHKIEINKYTWNALAMQMQCDADAAHRFASDCIEEFGLLHSDDQYFWSNSLNRRMNVKNEKSEKARKAAEARWGKVNDSKASAKKKKNLSEHNASAMQTHSERNAIKESKEKESKEKESKDVVEKQKASEPATSSSNHPITFYEDNCGRLSAINMQEIDHFLNDFGGDYDIINRAITIACDRNKRNFGFVKSILKDWLNNNATTMRAIDLHEKSKFKKSDPEKSMFTPSPETLRRQAEPLNLTDQERKELEEFEESLPY